MTDIEKQNCLDDMCDHGVSRLDRTDSPYFNGAPGDPEQKLGFPPDDNDPNGSQFWLDSNDMDPVWDSHDSELAGHAIGYPEKTDGTSSFEPGEYARRN